MAATSSVFEEDGTTLLTFADGRTIRAPSALLYDASGNPLITNPAVTGQSGAGLLATAPLLYDPIAAAYNADAEVVTGTALASAARTATTTSAVISSHGKKGIVVFILITAASGTGGLQLRVFAYDPVMATGFNFMEPSAPTALTTATRATYWYHPGISLTPPQGPGATYSIFLPSQIQIEVVHGDSSSYTYQVTYSLIP